MPRKTGLLIAPPQIGHWVGAALTFSTSVLSTGHPVACRVEVARRDGPAFVKILDLCPVNEALPGIAVLPINVEMGAIHRSAARKAQFQVVFVTEQALLAGLDLLRENNGDFLLQLLDLLLLGCNEKHFLGSDFLLLLKEETLVGQIKHALRIIL